MNEKKQDDDLSNMNATDKQSISSIKLCKVLDDVGLSENMRKVWVDFGITTEVILNLRTQYMGKNIGLFKFGSGIEGSTTPGLNSDLDFLVRDPVPVIEHLDDAVSNGLCLMIVQDPDTKPGYVKLQAVQNGIPLTEAERDTVEPRKHYAVDNKGRLVRNNVTSLADRLNQSTKTGPAQKCQDGTFGSIDYVEGYYCRKFPHSLAPDWAKRKATFKTWPTPSTLSKMDNYGCFFVAVGHPKSCESHLEWRASFSLHERALAFQLTPPQFKCYTLLKIIKNELIHPVCGEGFSSYHCKTCVFYELENTDESVWRDDNLIENVHKCLQRILRWAKEGNCPNFFVQSENMFDRRVYGEVREKLEHVLGAILVNLEAHLLDIKCDGIGEALRKIHKGDRSEMALDESKSCIKDALAKFLYKIHMDIICELSTNTNRILSAVAKDPNTQETINAHFSHLELMDGLESITFHDKDTTSKALNFVYPYIHTSLASSLMAESISTKDSSLRDKNKALGACHFSQGTSSDLMSSKLKMACVDYMLGNTSASCCALKELGSHMDKWPVISCCGCRHIEMVDNEEVVQMIKEDRNISITTKHLLRGYVCTCVQFQMSEMNIIPYPLRYELFRSVGAPDGSLGGLNDYWYKTATMDAKVCLYFLQYLVYARMNVPENKKNATKKLLETVKNDKNLKHKETAFTLIGWIYKEEGYLQDAVKWYARSWCFLKDLETKAWSSVNRHHNAVKWHILVLVYEKWLELNQHI